MDEEPESNAGYIVIVVIIIVLILVALVVFGLHYKRKLPESFYNLGGFLKGDKQWKPVLSKVSMIFHIVSQLILLDGTPKPNRVDFFIHFHRTQMKISKIIQRS